MADVLNWNTFPVGKGTAPIDKVGQRLEQLLSQPRLQRHQCSELKGILMNQH